MEITFKKTAHYKRKLPNGKHEGGRMYCNAGKKEVELTYEQVILRDPINCEECEHECRVTTVKAFDYSTLIIQISNRKRK